MSGGYNPKVSNPRLSNNIPQMRSEEFQTPFFFGGSQTPIALGLPAGSFSGSGMKGLRHTGGNGLYAGKARGGRVYGGRIFSLGKR